MGKCVNFMGRELTVQSVRESAAGACLVVRSILFRLFIICNNLQYTLLSKSLITITSYLYKIAVKCGIQNTNIMKHCYENSIQISMVAI